MGPSSRAISAPPAHARHAPIKNPTRGANTIGTPARYPIRAVLRSGSMDPERLRLLLEAVRAGQKAVDDAVAELKDLPFVDLGYATVDHHRALRQGMPEVVFG